MKKNGGQSPRGRFFESIGGARSEAENAKRILESFGFSVENSNYPEIRAEAEARL